jgi:hypothetical protein
MSFGPPPIPSPMFGRANAQVTLNAHTYGTPGGGEDHIAGVTTTTAETNVVAYISEASTAEAIEASAVVGRTVLECFVDAYKPDGTARTIDSEGNVVWNGRTFRIQGDPIKAGATGSVLQLNLVEID